MNNRLLPIVGAALVLVFTPQLATQRTAVASGGAHKVLMRVDGVTGSSVMQGYQGWVEVNDYAFDLTQAQSPTGTAAARAQLSDVVVRGAVDALAFPVLFQRAAQGRQIKTVEIHVLDMASGTTPTLLMKLELSEVILGRVGVVARQGALQQDIALRFDRIEWTTFPPRVSPVRGSWIVSAQRTF